MINPKKFKKNKKINNQRCLEGINLINNENISIEEINSENIDIEENNSENSDNSEVFLLEEKTNLENKISELENIISNLNYEFLEKNNLLTQNFREKELLLVQEFEKNTLLTQNLKEKELLLVQEFEKNNLLTENFKEKELLLLEEIEKNNLLTEKVDNLTKLNNDFEIKLERQQTVDLLLKIKDTLTNKNKEKELTESDKSTIQIIDNNEENKNIKKGKRVNNMFFRF
jgi:hypothetical protein